MKASDRGIIFGVVLVAALIGFYLLILGPKRDQASKLSSQVDDLQASITQQQQVVSFGEQARNDFPKFYGRLVVLGKAVPARADTSSMLVQLNSIADRSKVQMDAISLSTASSGGSGSSSDASSSASSTTSGSSTASAGSSTSTTSTSVPATEAAAALQPLGAVVGSAGLPTMPYQLDVQGSFFDMAGFIGGLDGLVTPTDGGASVSPDGRLFTINGFSMSASQPGSSTLLASFSVTTYVTPADQGLTGGASPTAPAPATPSASDAQPASAVVAK